MIVELLPIVLASMMLPAWIIITLLLLRGQGGVMKAGLFAAGAILVRSLIIFLLHFVFASAADREDAESAGLISSALLMLVGGVLLIAAYKKWRKEEDPDGPPPKWMETLGSMTTPKAFGFGALFMLVAVKQWVFTLTAIAIVEEAKLPAGETLLAFVFFVLGSMALVLLPVILSAIAPKPAAQALEKTMGFLERYNRPITVGASLIFSVWFLFKGITGLMG